MTYIDFKLKKYLPLKSKFEFVPLLSTIKLIPSSNKLSKKHYLENGKYPIVDQGNSLISGYTNENDPTSIKECIVFGDHTRIIKYIDFPFYPGADGIKIFNSKNENIFLTKFIFYYINSLEITNLGYSRHWKLFEDFKIPLIPLKIQEKIVEILERFRILEAELKAELEARGKQFDFTLTKIFNFKQYKLKKLWEITFWDKKFQEVEKFKQSKTSNFKYLFYKEIENYNDPNGDVKIITTGKEENLKINSKNYKKDIYSGEVLLIPGGGEANIKYHKGKFVTGDNRIGQVLNKNEVATKFLYYYFLLNLDLIRKNFRGGSIKHPFMKNILELNIPIPPIETQNKIVSILDKLSEYSQEINSGLPAEIELRSKQFKYYRDQLLNFKNNE